jgi:glycosyltransferase involved in cell wall biosynthesis
MKRILYDVTTLEDHPIKDGIRRVSYNWLQRIARRHPSETGAIVVPVYCGNGVLQPSYNFLINELFQESNSFVRQQAITVTEDDIFVIPSYDIFVPQMNFSFSEIVGRAKIISVIYDLLPISNPEWFPDEGVNDRFRSALDKQCFYSDRLIVNSSHVASKINEYVLSSGYSYAQKQISVVPLLGSALEISSKLEIERQGLQILCVGTIEPRKGYQDLLEALVKMESITFNVVIIGRLGWQADNLLPLLKKCQKRFGDKFRWEKSASDSLLEGEYQKSDIVFCLSKDEGFGLPVVEALTRKVPCLVRNIPVFREVSKGAAVTFGTDGDYRDILEVLGDLENVIKLAKERLLQFVPTTEEDNFNVLINAISF